ncbi:MAG: spermidine synthase [Canibacter sp.]
MILPAPVVLPSGERAEFIPDPFVPGTFQLVVAGTPQSHINPSHPEELFFDYIRRIGHVIDECVPTGEPITAVHLGAGALTLPRYIAATRRGSLQQVIELHGELVDFVREAFPIPKQARIRIRRGDAREVAAKLPSGVRGKADIVVVDVFAGAQTPAHLTTVEFYRELSPLLASHGVIAVNAADGAGMMFVKSQLATLKNVFRHVAAIGEPQVLKGRRFGNVILLGTNAEDGWSWLPRTVTSGPFPARLLEGDELTVFIGQVRPVADTAAKPSPLPPKDVFGTNG